jgi:hypothetical protein
MPTFKPKLIGMRSPLGLKSSILEVDVAASYLPEDALYETKAT